MQDPKELRNHQDIPPDGFELPALTLPLDEKALRHGLTCLVEMGRYSTSREDSDHIFYTAAFLRSRMVNEGLNTDYLTNDKPLQGGDHE